jgi:hypothetical protein
MSILFAILFFVLWLILLLPRKPSTFNQLRPPSVIYAGSKSNLRFDKNGNVVDKDGNIVKTISLKELLNDRNNKA